MKVAQLIATIPDALPAEYAAELAQLQSNAPPMSKPFVRRRMVAELGPDWAKRFAEFPLEPAAAASLGQVHKVVLHDGRTVACKLQYPNMEAAVDADLSQLRLIFGLHGRYDSVDRHQPDLRGDRGPAARGARLRAGGAASRPLPRDARRRAAHPRARSWCPSCRRAGC